MNVEIIKFDHFGRGIARIDNKVYFVNNALPKEIVKIKVIKEKKYYTEAEITKIFTELKLHLRDAKQKYDDRDYAPTDIINLSNYLNSLEWCLCMCRDRLVGISHDVHNDISDYAHK